jgi:hypothetical protein
VKSLGSKEQIPFDKSAAGTPDSTGFGIVNVKEYGTKGDGSTDDTAAIQTAIHAARQMGGATVYLPNGIYRVRELHLYSHVDLLGSSNVTLLKNRGGPDTHILNLIGSLTTTQTTLTAHASLGTKTLSVRTASGFQVGDFVLVRDNVYKYSTFGRNQELNRIEATGPGTITLATATIGEYPTAKMAEIIKLHPVHHVRVKNLTLKIEHGVYGGNLYGDYCYDVLVEDCVGIGPNDDPAFRFGNSAHCTINRCVARDGQNVDQSGFGYGFGFGASAHHCVIQNSYSENIRENYFTDNTRYCAFLNNTDVRCRDNMINTHSNGSEHVLISGNVSLSSRQYGITIGQDKGNAIDQYVIVQNNRVVNSASAAIQVNNAENIIVSGNQIIKPCTSTAHNAIGAEHSKYISIKDNIVDVQYSPNCAYVIRARQSQYVTIKDNIGCNGADYGVGFSYCDHVNIQGNMFRGLASYTVRNTTGYPNTNTNVTIMENFSDTTSFEWEQGDVHYGNIFGNKRDTNAGAATIGDGGKIAHQLNGTPRSVRVSGSVAGQIVTVTAVDSASITVAIKTSTGSAGSNQKIYWQADL